MRTSWDELQRLQRSMAQAEAIVIGAGAGLSAAAGYTYDGARFRQHFADFEAAYGFHDMYSGGFYPFPKPEIKWAYWSKMIHCNRYTPPPFPVYDQLYQLVKDSNYFVLTTNVDHCFQRAGFARARLFYTQGDYGLFQCSVPCRQVTYDNEAQIRTMMAAQKHLEIPTELIPHCPNCGAPLTTNLRADSKFVEDQAWHDAAKRYSQFIQQVKEQKVLYLELGVGYNTPGIIKVPFWQMTAENKHATYASINMGETACPPEIKDRAILLDMDIRAAIESLTEMAGKSAESVDRTK